MKKAIGSALLTKTKEEKENVIKNLDVLSSNLMD